MAYGLPVFLPLLAALGTALAFVAVLRRRQGRVPVFEVGVVYVGVVALYLGYPLIGYAANGYRYGPLADHRLFVLQPGPSEIGAVAWYYVVHLLGFVVAYLAIRGRLRRCDPKPVPSSRAVLTATVLCAAIVLGFFGALSVLFDMTVHTYAETYLVARRLPVVLAQLSNRLGQISWALEVLLLAALFSRLRSALRPVLVWMLATLLVAVVGSGSRTHFFLLTGSAVMMYAWQVRPLALSRLAPWLGAGLALFLALGVWRAGPADESSCANVFCRSTEFDILFGNAFDLRTRRQAGAYTHLPAGFAFTDLMAIVPRQVLPMVKVSPADWYVETFYPGYAASGGGYAFGTISESVVGGGLLDAGLRGATLGVLLAALHRFLMGRFPSFWRLSFYVWISTQVHHLFRNTTFCLLSATFYGFIPAALAVAAVATLLRALSVRSRQHADSTGRAAGIGIS